LEYAGIVAIGVKNMADTVTLLPIRERIKDLNTKAYYLLVALSFVYRTDSGSRLLKSAFTLTAIAAVLPIQDYVKSAFWLEFFRTAKVIFLTASLILTVFWIWEAGATPH
jgi:hypothetical protein